MKLFRGTRVGAKAEMRLRLCCCQMLGLKGRRAKASENRVSSAPWSAGVTERIKQIISLLQASFSV